MTKIVEITLSFFYVDCIQYREEYEEE